MDDRLPIRTLSAGKNNARLVRFAQGAYSKEYLPALDTFLQDFGGGAIHWSQGNASGLLAEYQLTFPSGEIRTQLVIGIAGSNDRQDWLQNMATRAQMLRDWEKATEIKVCPDSLWIRAPAGFLGHLSQVVTGVRRAADDHGVSLTADDLWITGHSLGGAVACLMQFVDGFADSSAHVYGVPKVVKTWCDAPARRCYRTVDLFDPVSMVPPSCKHVAMDQRILTPVGARSTIPGQYRFQYGVLVAWYWILGFGKTMARGHDIGRYERKLEGLR